MEAAERVRDRLDQLAAIGVEHGHGITRLAYTAQERAAHECFARWGEDEGAQVTVDRAGNSIAAFRDGVPYVLVGSHLDTVASGGAYDGAAGVVAGFETARSIAEEVGTGVRVVAFAGEEGARFGRPNLGSAAAAGLLTSEAIGRLIDSAGITLADASAELGLSPGQSSPWLRHDIALFLEVHIEQGRQLEAGAARIGLVDAIAGSVRLRFVFTGRADHSGATPMRMRSDALVAASELVLAVEVVARRHRSTVATVGRLELQPNSVTTVPGHVTLWIDVRDVDADLQRLAARAIFERAQEIEESRDVLISGQVISEQAPVVLAAWPRVIAHEECRERALPYRVLSSGAGHDAAVVAGFAPATMLFIPCVAGISHSPRELASPADIVAAADVAAGILRQASRLTATEVSTLTSLAAPPGQQV